MANNTQLLYDSRPSSGEGVKAARLALLRDPIFGPAEVFDEEGPDINQGVFRGSLEFNHPENSSQNASYDVISQAIDVVSGLGKNVLEATPGILKDTGGAFFDLLKDEVIGVPSAFQRAFENENPNALNPDKRSNQESTNKKTPEEQAQITRWLNVLKETDTLINKIDQEMGLKDAVRITGDTGATMSKETRNIALKRQANYQGEKPNSPYELVQLRMFLMGQEEATEQINNEQSSAGSNVDLRQSSMAEHTAGGHVLTTAG